MAGPQQFGSIYFTADGSMFDLDEVIAATPGNTDNDVCFVRMRGDHLEGSHQIAPGGKHFLEALFIHQRDKWLNKEGK